MENEKKELERSEIQDPHKNRYVVYTKRDTELMKTFIRFDNRVRHPRMGVNTGLVGILLLLMPVIVKDMGTAGKVIGVCVGTLLLCIALFRVHISVGMMKNNPEVKENEEIIYSEIVESGLERSAELKISDIIRRFTISGKMKEIIM